MSYLDVFARDGRKVMHLKLSLIRGMVFRREYIFRIKFDYPFPRDIACQKWIQKKIYELRCVIQLDTTVSRINRGDNKVQSINRRSIARN